MNNKLPKVNFIGNKEKIATIICENIPRDTKIFFDAFSGSSSVGYEAKKRGYGVISNDVMKINYLIAKAFVENHKQILTSKDLDILFSGKPIKGYMYKNYKNILYYPDECMELDQYRNNIFKLKNKHKKALAFTLLRRAMIRKMPYSRFNLSWKKIKQLRDEEYSYKMYKRKRAYHNKSIKSHVLENLIDYNNAVFDNSKKNKALNMNIFSALKKAKADTIYLDPPYTGSMNNYFDFYNPLDELVDSKKKKPFKNNFIDKNKSLVLFDKLFSRLSSYRYWMLSYNDSSYPSINELRNLLQKYSTNIKEIKLPHAYKLTGKKNKNLNNEFLFIITTS